MTIIYRLLRRMWDRFETFYICFFRFFHRVWRYRKVLAHDYDFDWVPLATFMELKLLAMADCLDEKIHVRDEVRARQCRVSAELCRRMRDDVWLDMHGTDTRVDCRRIQRSEREAERYLGMLIGKHLRCWWC